MDAYTRLQSDADGLSEMLEMATAEEAEMLAEEQTRLQRDVDELYRETLFIMKHADAAAIVRVKSGAGGTESQDWAGMLERMFMRWGERRGYKVELLDQQDGDQAGITSAEFIIRGEKAFGMLAPENGVHRLVRVSPFDSNNRRHTSFASVDVVPEVPVEEINIHIPDSDLRRDVFRSQGAGGQGVNTTDSAVRLTHIPTGIAVASQVTRSQIKNHDIALQILKQRLYDIEMKKREAEEAAARGEQKQIEWGSQIRSYVLDKQYVKDHRTGVMRHNSPGFWTATSTSSCGRAWNGWRANAPPRNWTSRSDNLHRMTEFDALQHAVERSASRAAGRDAGLRGVSDGALPRAPARQRAGPAAQQRHHRSRCPIRSQRSARAAGGLARRLVPAGAVRGAGAGAPRRPEFVGEYGPQGSSGCIWWARPICWPWDAR